jgi:hypothetical protein
MEDIRKTRLGVSWLLSPGKAGLSPLGVQHHNIRSLLPKLVNADYKDSALL